MQRDIPGRNAEKDQVLQTRNLGTTIPLRSTSVTDGHTEFNGNESLLVKGSQKVSGWLIVTGTLKVVGAFLLEGATTMTGNLVSSGTALFTGAFTSRGTTRFEGDTSQVGPLHIIGATDATGAFTSKGVTRFEGDTTQVGPLHVQGNQDNTGTLGIKGVTTLESDLNVTAGGRVKAGNTIITSSGVVGSTTSLLLSSATGTTVLGDFAVTGAKSFRIPHPSRDGYSLTHGSTESPVSGTEYWGTGTLDATGECKVSLPAYFEALNKPGGRAVIVCPIGRPFAAGADEITAGKFTAYGTPGRKFAWLVKAERIGADFVAEAPAIAAEEAAPDLGLTDEL
ncbi:MULTISPECIES: hypothetical protein [unclassified Cryobacterium]|uniref:hypothetical protein n=1 Tax=unclassified Cryobacterium TaxID=2649013 RepID=UPI00106A96FE|nr:MULTISPECIES: hypothetical protein [unclassified Cryobacterium]TFC59402.1 hypothetical protein E3O68_00440 [Cryobacterium sp. TMB3-1-2]TFC67198.1 hypothetical protein E3T21_17135 [Cryobacterium sp. TMB3-15]TFC73289.1 hypothetical protein E3T22_16920 [Cryobacterium sp. TMB3-10]TFD46177.1 hypothetical protein E3T58_01555 [Cryobacterium sp. TMB3-12]